MLYKSDRPSFDLEGDAQGHLKSSKDSQDMISYRLITHFKPLELIIRELRPLKSDRPSFDLEGGAQGQI